MAGNETATSSKNFVYNLRMDRVDWAAANEECTDHKRTKQSLWPLHPAPVIDAIFPIAGPMAGGTLVSVTGTLPRTPSGRRLRKRTKQELTALLN